MNSFNQFQQYLLGIHYVSGSITGTDLLKHGMHYWKKLQIYFLLENLKR